MRTAPAARLKDSTAKGVIVSASGDVFVNNIKSARLTDPVVGSGCSGSIATGSGTVFVNNLQSARIGDPTACGPIVGGSGNVYTGG